MSSRNYKCAAPACLNKARRDGFCEGCSKTREAGVSVPSQVAADRERVKQTAEAATDRLKYATALKEITRLEQQLAQVVDISAGREPLMIEEHYGSGTGEATVVMVASDWHIEELVRPETISGLNRYTLEIAERRVKSFFSSGVRLIDLLNQDVKIPNVVLALLGDFISNAELHGGDNAENMQLPPTEAVKLASSWIIGGIEFLLNYTDKNLVIPCHSGNHARTTKQTRFGSENGHSLEYLMYLLIAARFHGEPRVQMSIAEGMHSYLPIYDQTVRFQHGHAVKYGGGVGGIYIPVNKAIGQWNKARNVDLDVFGHFHQMRDGGNFICNGSLIGYNSFALSIKADFELPKQALFLMDKKRGRTCTWPILMKGDK